MTTQSKRVMPAMTTVVAAMIVSVGVLSFPLSMANAQQSDTVMGTVASIQNGKDGKPAWITSGAWDFKNREFQFSNV